LVVYEKIGDTANIGDTPVTVCSDTDSMVKDAFMKFVNNNLGYLVRNIIVIDRRCKEHPYYVLGRHL